MQKGFAPIIVLIIAALMVGAGLFVWSSYSNNKTKTPPVVQTKSTPAPQKTEASNSADIANWKTYTNTKYGYSLKYPPDWIEKIKCQGGIPEDDYICFLSPDFEESLAGAVMGSTLKGGLVWIDGKGDIVGYSPEGFCSPGGTVTISECKEITVTGLSAMQRKWGTNLQIGILRSNKFVLSLHVIYNTESEKGILNTFNQILSTFKFLP